MIVRQVKQVKASKSKTYSPGRFDLVFLFSFFFFLFGFLFPFRYCLISEITSRFDFSLGFGTEKEREERRRERRERERGEKEERESFNTTHIRQDTLIYVQSKQNSPRKPPTPRCCSSLRVEKKDNDNDNNKLDKKIQHTDHA